MPSDVIVQLFDQPFSWIEERLDSLAEIGYSHILISPPQKSHPGQEWWARYQPVDFTKIEGPLGSENQLRSLCQSASNRGISIIADTVLNHLADHPDYITIEGCQITSTSYPRFSLWDLHSRCQPTSDIDLWLGFPDGRGLPDLRTESPYVRQELRTYLHYLKSLGISGFRFDAAKHIGWDFFSHVLDGLEDTRNFGEFVYQEASSFPPAYLEFMQAYDFPLAATLKESFLPGGDLRRLLDPEEYGDALWGPQAITFVRHHDIAQEPERWDSYLISNPDDQILAYLYILGREDGTPFVYLDRWDHPQITAGVKFHNAVLGQAQEWIDASANHLAWKRGNSALAAINKADFPIAISGHLQAGQYRDLLTNEMTPIPGAFHHLIVPPRGARLLLRQD